MTLKERVTSLARVFLLAAHLGNPQLRLPAYVHVAGVSGKSSVVLILARLLQKTCSLAKTQCVGSFTYPSATSHDDRECIRLNGQWVGEKEYLHLRQHVDSVDAIYSTACSAYERLFLTALIVFLHHACHVVVLEAALGGLYDATNIMDRVDSGAAHDGVDLETSAVHASHLLAAGITTITNDHLAVLGPTMDDLLRHLLAVRRASAPVIFQDDVDEGEDVDVDVDEDVDVDVDGGEDEALDSAEHGTAGRVFKKRKHWLAASVAQIDNALFAKDVLKRDGSGDCTSMVLAMEPVFQAGNVDMALALYAVVAPQLHARSGLPPARNALTDFVVEGRPSRFYMRNREVLVDAAQHASSPLFRAKHLWSARHGRVHLVLGLSSARTIEQHASLFAALGCSADYRYTFVPIAAPPGYGAVGVADAAQLTHCVLQHCHLLGVEPNITHYRTVEEVLQDGPADELIVVFGSTHVVADFFTAHVREPHADAAISACV